MKKFDFDKKYVQIAILAIIVLIFVTLFEKVVGNIDIIIERISITLDFIFTLLKPFFIAFFIAYFLNPMVRTIENSKLVSQREILFKRKRNFSIFCTYIFALLFIYLVISSILPSVVRNINSLIVDLPASINNARIMFTRYTQKNNNIIDPSIEIVNKLTNQDYSTNHIFTSVVKTVSTAIFNLPDLLSSVVVGVVTFANGVIAIILGFVISIYMIADKEYFKEQFKKIVIVITKEKTSERIFRIADMSNVVLEKFIIGKAIDSTIIGLMFFVICLIFKIPYAPLFGLVIGITNMIPYFGPFIGAVPVLLITLTWNYKMFLPVSAAILILQQFDGVILGPKILGDSIGLKPISIILAILVGGGLFGVLGMFLGAPVYAVVATVVNELIDKNYDKKIK